MKIGLLGGSFNPGHSGHIYISNQALKRLRLNQVWWLVCKNNPLKNTQYPNCHERAEYAKKITEKYRNIKIIESDDIYTFKTLDLLSKKFPSYKFIWLMGMDSLINFHKWDRWEIINKMVSMAIFNRSNHFHQALRSKFAVRFKQNFSIHENEKKFWTFLFVKKLDISSTEIRNSGIVNIL